MFSVLADILTYISGSVMFGGNVQRKNTKERINSKSSFVTSCRIRIEIIQFKMAIE